MIRIYLTPFQDSGEFGDEIEITNDVDLGSLGKIKRSLDNSTYDIGVLRYNNLNLKLQNSHGKYSDVLNLRSVFRFRRSGSKIRVTWAPGPPAICGVAICGQTILSEEVNIFRGILNDDAAKMSADDQIIQFIALSYDSQFSKLIVPFADLDAGDTLKDVLVKILDQPAMTRYATIDPDNFDLQVNYVIDDLSWFENKTAKEAVEKILLAANSVVFVEDESIKTRGRITTEDVMFSFFGQASTLGNENIASIDDFRNGQNRLINFIRWRDEGEALRDDESITKWGASLKEIDCEFVTNGVKQLQTATSILGEFAQPKKELSLGALMDADTIELKFLDRVDIDYPTVFKPSGKYVPIIGLTKVGDLDSPLPHILWDFWLAQDENFKIMGIELDLKNEKVTFDLRGT